MTKKRSTEISRLMDKINEDLEPVLRVREQALKNQQFLKEIFKDSPECIKEIEKQAAEFYHHNPKLCMEFLTRIVKMMKEDPDSLKRFL